MDADFVVSSTDGSLKADVHGIALASCGIKISIAAEKVPPGMQK